VSAARSVDTVGNGVTVGGCVGAAGWVGNRVASGDGVFAGIIVGIIVATGKFVDVSGTTVLCFPVQAAQKTIMSRIIKEVIRDRYG
jgi:hypothetical protein